MKKTLPILGLILSSSLVLAADQPTFAELDTNQDGYISSTEAEAHPPLKEYMTQTEKEQISDPEFHEWLGD